jgi:hypothetical protein
MGYPAERIYYSGAGLEKPYDVEVTFAKDDLLEIEAKRTWKEFLTLKDEWLKPVRDRHCVVFAMGPRINQKTAPMFALSKWPSDAFPKIENRQVKVGRRFQEMLVAMFDLQGVSITAPTISMTGKSFRVHLKDLARQSYTVLLYDGSVFLIQRFDAYMNREWSSRLVKPTED